MANDPERLIKDWQEVLRQGKQMELTLEKFFENIDLEGNPRTGEAGKDLEFYADQLKDKGDAIDLMIIPKMKSERWHTDMLLDVKKDAKNVV